MLLDTQALWTGQVHVGRVGSHRVLQINLDAVGRFPPNQHPHLPLMRKKSLGKEDFFNISLLQGL